MECTIDEWRAEFMRRCADESRISFDSVKDVAFVCPSCGTVYTLGEWAEASLCEDPASIINDGPAECIHRAAGDGECDWCAYGLFCGPVTVTHENGGKSYCFEFADKGSEGSKQWD